jgi:2,3-bisphosphoglycerate-dependent phosphoglycerate mutase|tara:strand:- start:1595 stop:2179 length:585 start_codon:yes stop_codon:yes gene_type:complete
MLILMRHGTSLYNEANLLTGRINANLSDNGIAETNYAGEELAKEKIRFDHVFTSPLTRCADTAKIILEKTFSVCDISEHDELQERDCGDLSGMSKEDALLQMGPRKFRTMRQSFDISYPAGESFDDVSARVAKWVEHELVPRYDRGQVLVVSHKHALRALCLLLGLAKDENVHTLAIAPATPIYVPWITLKRIL